MKTVNPKSVIILVVIILFSVSVFASGLNFRVRVYENDKELVAKTFQQSHKVLDVNGNLEIGDFENYLEAMKMQYTVEEKGFSKTELVAYFNHVEISLEDAFVLMDNRNQQDEDHVQPMSEMEMDLALRMVQNEDFYYSIQIGVYSEEAVNKFFDFPKQIDETITPKGYYRYSYGRFYTLQDAKDALVMLQDNYFETAFIIAFDDLERIPITAAIDKEQRLLEESIAAVTP
jgi:hypothetical protein